jgi:hypothetical protein
MASKPFSPVIVFAILAVVAVVAVFNVASTGLRAGIILALLVAGYVLWLRRGGNQ